MSLGRLLAAGKSLMGMKNTASPYRMTPQNYLPKFGSAKNPFVAPSSDAAKVSTAITPELPIVAPVVPTVSAVTPTPSAPAVVRAPEPVKLETASLFDSKPMAGEAFVVRAESKPAPEIPPSAQPGLPCVKPTPPPAPAMPAKKKLPLPLAAWTKKLNPLKYWPVSKPGQSSAKLYPARTPMQSELSLEKVKVVRNDLSDSDLEVVPARKTPVNPPLPADKKPEEVAEGAKAWGRLSSRIFRAGETPSS